MKSKEVSNFTYDDDEASKLSIPFIAAAACGVSVQEALGYFYELESDATLRSHIRQATIESKDRYVTDPEAHYGPRRISYAIVRAMKPKIVVEAGVEKGLGSCVIAAALLRNQQEGHAGHLFAVDIDEKTGYLIDSPYDAVCTKLNADILQFLKTFNNPIDYLVQDIAPWIAKDVLEALQPTASPKCIVTNCYFTEDPFEFALKNGWQCQTLFSQPEHSWFIGMFWCILYRGQ
ncbi:MAG TPA: class I SAM-dependent methyltransferase [Fimbriimonas sp.]|nr:class I SAM-dependent methyltransferase [Fimbriimonas sp.]